MARVGSQSKGGYPEFFDLFDQAGQNVVRAAELLEQLLASYPGLAGAGGGRARL